MSNLMVRWTVPAIAAVSILAGATGRQVRAELFRDSYSRADAAPPVDSLGTTEPGSGWVALDYRELNTPGGLASVLDVARVDAGRLAVVGLAGTTDPAFAEIAGAGRDLEFELTAEFLADELAAWEAADRLAIFLRQAGTGADGTIFTPGMVLLEMELDGYYVVRGVVGGAGSIVSLAQGTVDTDTLLTADLDGDGRLEVGEPFRLSVRLEAGWLSFDFNGVTQVSSLFLAGVPEPPEGGDRLLLGRNRISSARPSAIGLAFDLLATSGPVDADGDGAPADQDCDDADPSVYPGAAEACDGRDNDCDGSVPPAEGDADQDGIRACAGDCDDADAEVHPGAEEQCNALDDDCDGVVPEDEGDADGDGFAACGGDCVDGDAGVNPGAIEMPGNTSDENCDGARACDPTASWKNHGQYMKCVTHALHDLVRQGALRNIEVGGHVSRAAKAYRAEAGRR